MAIPVYSKRLFWKHNESTNQVYTNDTGATLIIKTFTAYYGGDDPGICFLTDEDSGAMIVISAPGAIAGPVFTWAIERDLHLVWPDGMAWTVAVGGGWDYSAHGYELSA